MSKVKEEDQVLVSLLGYQTKPAAAFAGYTGASLMVCGSEGGTWDLVQLGKHSVSEPQP